MAWKTSRKGMMNNGVGMDKLNFGQPLTPAIMQGCGPPARKQVWFRAERQSASLRYVGAPAPESDVPQTSKSASNLTPGCWLVSGFGLLAGLRPGRGFCEARHGSLFFIFPLSLSLCPFLTKEKDKDKEERRKMELLSVIVSPFVMLVQ
ncbi:MAG: hypothetical protein LBC18_01175 [Opitutaceae bacterium]|jgi:hypothetical protein|nr:hypothetical protein [Opitutaceae bacterium]